MLLAKFKEIDREEIMTKAKEEALANFVPAAAVIRGGRVLFILNGRKGCVDYFLFLII